MSDSAEPREPVPGGRTAIDLSACDREPIHLIGAIQPHGALLALEAGVVRHASANCAEWLGAGPGAVIGAALDDLLPQGAADEIARRIAESAASRGAEGAEQSPAGLDPAAVTLSPPGGPPRRLECLVHRTGAGVILELLEPGAEPGDMRAASELRQRLIAELVRPGTLDGLAQAGARALREATGFDRVMIYRFAEDGHGEVIAESTDRPDSLLGLHYPASDIPEPARRHFAMNALRIIPDIEATSVPVAGPAGALPLDLGRALLRAVAPVHVEYLRNMGVRATMSVSLVTGGRLWGLAVCHHYAARRLGLGRMQLAELLGATLSGLLQGIEDRTQLRRSMAAERLAFELEREGREGAPLDRIVADNADALMRLVDADGLVLRRAGEVTALGAPADAVEPEALRAALSGATRDGVALTDRLPEVLGLDAARSPFGGAAVVDLSEGGGDSLVLLRRTHEGTVRWAGRPDKVEIRTEGGQARLGPRRSFEVWREEHAGRSRAFDRHDREVLRILRRGLSALNSAERERVAVRARQQAQAQEERLRLAVLQASRRSAMEELAGALAHELNQPLAAVANYVGACRQQLRRHGAAVPGPVHALMDDAVGEAARAAELVRRLRDFVVAGALSPERMDLHATVRQSAELALLPAEDDAPDLALEFANDLPPVMADPVQIGQVVLNLAQNAVTAMRGRDERVLTLRTRRDGGMALVTVADTGPGIAPAARETLFRPFQGSTTGGMGFGLSLCRSIVEAHGGRIFATEPADGAEFVFSLPLDGPDHRLAR